MENLYRGDMEIEVTSEQATINGEVFSLREFMKIFHDELGGEQAARIQGQNGENRFFIITGPSGHEASHEIFIHSSKGSIDFEYIGKAPVYVSPWSA